MKRGPAKWEWQVSNRQETILIHGWENPRRAAKYKGDRALFLLLAGSRNL
jgi:hypothetical protein